LRRPRSQCQYYPGKPDAGNAIWKLSTTANASKAPEPGTAIIQGIQQRQRTTELHAAGEGVDAEFNLVIDTELNIKNDC